MNEKLELPCRRKRINALEREIKDLLVKLKRCSILSDSKGISRSSSRMEQLKIGYHYSKDNNG